jgi:kynurenine 3-monooxygenase
MVEVDLGPKSVAIVGAGLVGCLLGVYLRKHGFVVEFFESRRDPRLGMETGRSINLVITSRGINALTGVSEEVAEKVMAITTRVEGRTLHDKEGKTLYQSYGPDDTYCNFSVSRWELNCVLMTAAEDAGCKFHFNSPLQHIDIPSAKLYFYLMEGGSLFQKVVTATHIFGADGGGSRCRQANKGLNGEAGEDRGLPLGFGYKELTMPALEGGVPSAHKDSLHIWPRGTHFMMGLYNRDGSFTMTLYAPNKAEKEGDVAFGAIKTEEDVTALFTEHYSDAMPLMPAYKEEFLTNPVGFLGTVFTKPWVHGEKFALIGDAAHAFTPFFGQGCNSGFEDVAIFNELLTDMQAGGELDMARLFQLYYEERKPNTDAIANMALDNFEEMMSKTADRRFQIEQDIQNELSALDVSYKSRYVLITHSLLPYRLCQEAGVVQQTILTQLSEGLDDAANFDKALAKSLLDKHWKPFLAKHAITPARCHYSSKYYEK